MLVLAPYNLLLGRRNTIPFPVKMQLEFDLAYL